MTLLTKGLLGALLVVGALLAVQTWRVRAAQHDAIVAAVAPAKAEAARAAAVVETVTVTLAARIDTVTRLLRAAPRTDTLMLRPQTGKDSATAVGQLPRLAASFDALSASCRATVLTCGEYRVAAERRFRADSGVIATQEALLRDRPPRRHWLLGLTLGYGGTVTRDGSGAVRLYAGPTLSAGLTWTPF